MRWSIRDLGGRVKGHASAASGNDDGLETYGGALKMSTGVVINGSVAMSELDPGDGKG
jgi:hypothetical protein